MCFQIFWKNQNDFLSFCEFIIIIWINIWIIFYYYLNNYKTSLGFLSVLRSTQSMRSFKALFSSEKKEFVAADVVVPFSVLLFCLFFLITSRRFTHGLACIIVVIFSSIVTRFLIMMINFLTMMINIITILLLLFFFVVDDVDEKQLLVD